jgi:hypothetical protein
MVAAIAMLGACNPTATPTAPPTTAATVDTGLSADDQQATKAGILGRLLQRKRPYIYNGVQMCSQFFSLGEPKIVDSTLGAQTGKVHVLVPIAVSHPLNDGTAPDKDCYGYSHPGWVLNQAYDEPFEFQIERWETGWRVAQIQENGF